MPSVLEIMERQEEPETPAPLVELIPAPKIPTTQPVTPPEPLVTPLTAPLAPAPPVGRSVADVLGLSTAAPPAPAPAVPPSELPAVDGFRLDLRSPAITAPSAEFGGQFFEGSPREPGILQRVFETATGGAVRTGSALLRFLGRESIKDVPDWVPGVTPETKKQFRAIRETNIFTTAGKALDVLAEAHPEWTPKQVDSFWQLVKDPQAVAENLAAMVPYMAVTTAAFLAGGPTAAATVAYAVEGQGAFDEAIASGATYEQARQAAMITGSINAIIETAQIGGILKFGKGAQSAVAKAATRLAKAKVAARQVAKLAIREGIEEALQGTTQEIVAKGVFGKPLSDNFWDQRLIETTLGAIAGVGGGAVSLGVEAVRQRGAAPEAAPEAPVPPIEPELAPEVPEAAPEPTEVAPEAPIVPPEAEIIPAPEVSPAEKPSGLERRTEPPVAKPAVVPPEIAGEVPLTPPVPAEVVTPPKAPKVPAKPEPQSAIDIVAEEAFPRFAAMRRGDAPISQPLPSTGAFEPKARGPLARNRLAALHKALSDNIIQKLPLSRRAAMMRAVAGASTPGQLASVASRIDRIAAETAGAEPERAYTPSEIQEIATKYEARGESKGFRAGQLAKKANQAELLDFIKNSLPLKERGRMLATIKNIRAGAPGARDLVKARVAVRKVYNAWNKREALKAYDQVAAQVKGKKVQVLRRQYREAVTGLLDSLTRHKITAKTRDTLQATVDALDLNPELESNELFQVAHARALEALARADGKLVTDMPADDIRALTTQLEAMLHYNKFANQLFFGQKARRLDEAGKQAATEVNTQGKQKFRAVEFPEKRKTPGIIIRAGRHAQRDAEMLWMTLGPEEGAVAHEVGFREIIRGENKYWGNMRDNITTILDSLAERGIKFDRDMLVRMDERVALDQPREKGIKRRHAEVHTVNLPTATYGGKREGVKVGSVKMDSNRRMMLLASLRDSETRALLLARNSGGFNWADARREDPIILQAEDIAAIEASATEEENAIVDVMLGLINGPIKGRLNDAFHERHGRDLAFRDDYTPRQANWDLAGGKRTRDPLDYVTQTTMESFGWTKARVTHRHPLVIGGFFETIIRHIDETEFYSAMTRPVTNAQRLTGQPDFAKSVEDNLGKAYLDRLDTYINDVGRMAQLRSPLLGALAEIVTKFKPKAYRAILLFKPFLALKQYLSGPLAAIETGGALRELWRFPIGLAGPATKTVRQEYEEWTELSVRAWMRFRGSPMKVLGPLAETSGVEEWFFGRKKGTGAYLTGMYDAGGVLNAVDMAKTQFIGQHPELKGKGRDARKWPQELQDVYVPRGEEVVQRSQPSFTGSEQSSFARDAKRNPVAGFFTMWMAFRNKFWNTVGRTIWRMKNKHISVSKGIGVLAFAGAVGIGFNLLVNELRSWTRRGFKPRRRGRRLTGRAIAGRVVEGVTGLSYGAKEAGALIDSVSSLVDDKVRLSDRDPNPLLEGFARIGKGVVALGKGARVIGSTEKVKSGRFKGWEKRQAEAAKAAENIAQGLGILTGTPVAGPLAIATTIKRATEADSDDRIMEAYLDAYEERADAAAAGKKVSGKEFRATLSALTARIREAKGIERKPAEFRKIARQRLRTAARKRFYQAAIDGDEDDVREEAKRLKSLGEDGKRIHRTLLSRRKAKDLDVAAWRLARRMLLREGLMP